MSKSKPIPWQCRQGDVFLERIEDATATGPEVKRDAAGRIILAHGEATGHAHVVRKRGAVMRELAPDQTEVGDAVWAHLMLGLESGELAHDCPGQAKPDHDPIPLPPGDYAVVQQLQYTPEAVIPVID